jgi:hypothetical protein
MKWFLYVIGFICIGFGCWVILYTKETRNFVKGLFNNVDRRILSAFEVIMGILLLFSATTNHYPFLDFVDLNGKKLILFFKISASQIPL